MKIKITEKKRETPPDFNGMFSEDGGLSFGTYTRIHLKKFAKENPKMPFKLVPLLPESIDQRGFFEGGVIPLWVFLDKKDYKSSKIIKQYHEFSKQEFNSEIVVIGGKPRKVAQSTKNKLNQGFLERIIGYLEDNYGIDSTKVLNPATYKHYKEKIYPNDTTMKYDTFIDYMIDIKLLK